MRSSMAPSRLSGTKLKTAYMRKRASLPGAWRLPDHIMTNQNFDIIQPFAIEGLGHSRTLGADGLGLARYFGPA